MVVDGSLATDHGDAQGDGFGIVSHQRIKVFLSIVPLPTGFLLGREVIWRHDATHRLATDFPSSPFGVMAARQCPGLRGYACWVFAASN
jgi:hypothetical protein